MNDQPHEVLSGRDMLCFSHDWTGDPLSKTHVMRLLSSDNRVLWVNSISYRAPRPTVADGRRMINKLYSAMTPVTQPEPQLYVMNPLAIPAWGVPGVGRLNRHLLAYQVCLVMKKLGFRNPINWVFNPAAGIVAGRLNEDKIIYYCVDQYTAFAHVPTASLKLIERDLLDKSDLIIVSADALFESKRSEHAETVMVRHGVDFELFNQSLNEDTEIPSVLQEISGPIIGYFGLIAEDWIDLPLLIHLAKSMPEVSLVMLGKVTMNVSSLAALPNVHLLGRQPYRSLPGFCRGFDVAIIPFPLSEVTLNANPLKAREYLAAGLPVVSTAIPEVEVLGQCAIARTPDEFVQQVRKALKTPGPSRERSETMRTESWAARIDEIRDHYLTHVGGE